jgi:aminopeptidase
VKKWKEVNDMIHQKRDILNDMKIEYVHVVWPDEDLKVKIWSDRARAAGSGCNIPSFEIFTSPDCRDINWRVRFNQPLYRYGNLIEWIELEFKDGFVTKAHATKNDNILQDMIKIDWMKQVWEFSLTDARTSKITKFMAETLFDENVWWQYGNTHIALWMAFDECYNWDKTKLDNPEFKKSIGLNTSAEHVDIISTANRTVTATLGDWSQKIIYENWMFTI